MVTRKVILLMIFIPKLVSAQTLRVEAEKFINQNGIQLVNVNDEGNQSQAVGYWNVGDFINLSFHPPKTGVYDFIFRMGTNIDGAKYELRDEAGKVLVTILPPNTGSHGSFRDVPAQVKLKAGSQVLKFISVNNNSGADINWIQFSYSRAEGAPLIKTDSVILVTGIPKNKTARVKLSAAASDEDGNVAAYQWKRISGKGGKLNNANAKIADLADLPHGNHIYQLTVIDNDKKSSSQNVRISVMMCAGGRKKIIDPPGGNGSGLYITAVGYTTRKHKYPTYNYPTPDIRPGDTIALSSKFEWGFFEMFGIDGTPGCPIVITSDGGITKIRRRIILTDCNYIKITGRANGDNSSEIDETGDGDYKLRIGESSIRDIAIGIQGRSSNIEIDKIRAENIWYGVQAKTDPPQDPMCDTMYNYPNWIMDSIHIHHSFFKNTLQDVLYLGNTDPFGDRTYKCNGQTVHFIPMRIANFNIHHNRILLANRTGIMLSGAESGHNHINDNHISDMGYEFNQQQGTGISLGGMTRNTHVYNNRIRNTFLYGIFDLATGINYIYNNYVDSSGYLNMRLYVDRKFNDTDSLAKALGLSAAGDFLKNNYQVGISNIQSTTKDTRRKIKKTIVIRNNILGYNSSSSAPHGNISFSEWGPAVDWTTKNIICGNTRLDKKTPVRINQYSHKSGKWPKYLEDCKTPVGKIRESQDDILLTNDSGQVSPVLIGVIGLFGMATLIYFFQKRTGRKRSYII